MKNVDQMCLKAIKKCVSVEIVEKLKQRGGRTASTFYPEARQAKKTWNLGPGRAIPFFVLYIKNEPAFFVSYIREGVEDAKLRLNVRDITEVGCRH